jgi:ribosomal protein S27AE
MPKQLLQIDFREIKSVHVACTNCGTQFSFNIPEKLTQEFVVLDYRKCAECGAVLWDRNQPRVNHLVGLIRDLGGWQEIEKPGFTLSFFTDLTRS